MGDDPVNDLTGALSAVLSRLPAPLADAPSRAAVMDVAQRLPAALAGGPLGLEVRLAGPTTVDVFAAAIPGTATFAGLIECLSRGGWADDRRAADLSVVLDRWQQREGALPRVARYLLVEADAPEHGAAVPVPSIFLAPRNPHDLYTPGMAPNAFAARPDLTTMAAAELSGVWPDPRTADAVGRVNALLPDGADMFAVGAMISRDAGASMRVAVRRLSPDQTHALLVSVGRPRQADLLAERAAGTTGIRQAVAFEVGPGAEHRVGLELAPDHDWKQCSLHGWEELLAEVVELGLADRDRADVVPGLVDGDSEPSWGLAHVKIAADDDGILPGSKLYIGLQHRQAQ